MPTRRSASLGANRFDGTRQHMPLLKALRAQMRALTAEAPSELPFRWLFAAAAEAVMIVDESTGQIVEANPAAAWLLRRRRGDLVGSAWLEAFDVPSRAPLTAALPAARGAATPNRVIVSSGDGATQLAAALGTFRVAADSYLLVRLEPASGKRLGGDASEVFETLDEAAASFLVTDAGLRIEYANRAFIAMVGAGDADDVHGRSIAHWLDLSERDIAQLSEQMSRGEAVTELLTTLRAEFESSRPVEVTAVAVPDDEHPRWGFSIRDLAAGGAPSPGDR
jgi:PAS domain-containing protein